MGRTQRPIIYVCDILAILIIAGYAVLAYTTTAQGAADWLWRSAQARGELLVGTDAGYRPFVDLENGHFSGYDVELMEEIGQRLGLQVRFVNIGYDALFDALQAGKIHVIAAGIPLMPEQAWRARFTTPYFDAGQILLVPAKSSIQGPHDLAGKRVAVALGSAADTEARRLRRTMPSLQIVDSPLSPSQVLQALHSGAADAAIVDAAAAITALNTSADVRLAAQLTSEPYVLAVPVEAYKLQEELNRVLAELRREGFFDRHNARWFR